MPPELVKALISAAAILYLWVFFAFVYRRHRVEVLRHQLFAARDRLFERACRGELTFDDLAYGMTRTIVNGLLRSADTLSIPTLFLFWMTRSFWSNQTLRERFDARFAGAREQLTPAGRAAVSATLAEVRFRVLSHLLHISVVFGPWLQLFKLALRVTDKAHNDWAQRLADTKRRTGLTHPISGALAVLDREAHQLGGLDRELAQAV